MAEKNCVYCNKEITTPSREHVIQNALGGLYESTDICCPECNNYISREIDSPFTTIFNPILGSVDDLVKTNHSGSMPPYTGTVKYNGKTYKANIKGGRVTGCPDLSRELRCNAAQLPLEIVSYDFNLPNDVFHNGITKIAFNYALAQGVDFDILKSGLNVQRIGDKVESIKFNYPMIPFMPINEVDKYIEIQTPLQLYHNMILFSHGARLWCYIDLFNTFQYYVLLSDKVPAGKTIYDEYMQTVQKMERTVPDITIYGPKDALMYANEYGVEPSMDNAEMTRRIKKVIEQKSYRTSIADIITDKIAGMPVTAMMHHMSDVSSMMQFNANISLYLDKYNRLRPQNFRTITAINGKEIMSYPDAINDVLHANPGAAKDYATAKFIRLNAFLCGKSK